MFDLDTRVRYVYNSNRLDGVTLDEATTRTILRDGISEQSFDGYDGREFEAETVSGHDRALNGLLLMAQSERPIDADSIRTLHRALMGDLLLSAGEFRECTLRYKGLLIASPPEHLQERMEWLSALIQSGLDKTNDAHKFSWRVHHEFITLHPFIEGNGRMARLVLNLIRLRRGLELSIIPFENRESYSRAIVEFQQQKIRRAQSKAQ